MNFRARHIEIDRKRLALFDRNRDRERDRDHAFGEEWRHDPGHRRNVPYRDAAVTALFGSGTPAANFNPAFRGRWTGPPRVEGPLGPPLPQQWQRSGMEGVQPLGGVQPALEGVDPTFRPPVGIGAQPFGSRGPGAIGARPFSGPHFGGVHPALEGVDPTESRAPVGQSLNRDAETRMLIERGLFGRVPPTALAAPLGGLRASPSFSGTGSTQSLDSRGSFRPLVGTGVQPFGGSEPATIGAQPLSGRGPQTPSGGMGAGGGRGGGG